MAEEINDWITPAEPKDDWVATSQDHPVAPEPEVLPDVAKSIGTGLVRGAVGLAGLPGDVGHLINRGIDWAENKLGVSTPESNASDSFTTPALTKGLEKITGSLYEPKTSYGKYAQTVGEFAPGIIGGPEGLASRALTRVVAPAVASEAAGQATQGTAIEPVARVGAAIAAHGAGQAGRNALGLGSRPSVPTIDELEAAKNAGYRQAQNLGVKFHRKPILDLADNIKSDLENDGFRARNAPQVFAAIKELRKPAGQYYTIDDIESVRKVLNKVWETGNRTEINAGRRVKNAIDGFLENATPADAAVNPHYVGMLSSIMRDARGNYGAMRGGENIIEKIDKANLRAGSTYSGSNLDNALRQNIRSFLDNPKLRNRLTPEAQAQARRIVGGTFAGNTARWFGKNLRFLGSMAGLHAAGVPGYVATHLAGHLLSEFGNELTAREAEILARMARADSPLFRSGTLPAESTLSWPAAYGTSAALAEQPTQEPRQPLKVNVTKTRQELGYASGGAVTKGTKAGMTAAQSRKASHYSPTRGIEEHHCGPVKEWHGGSCKFFKSPNACQLVGGHIAARGGCIWHQPLTKNRADGGSVTSGSNFDSANEALGFNKQEADLYRRHLSNLWSSGGVDNPDGSRSSLYQAVQEHNGKFYNIPTVWNGKIETQPYTHPSTGQQMEVPNQTAIDNVSKEGWDKFPSYNTPDEADSRYDQMHGFMEKDTQDYLKSMNSPVVDPIEGLNYSSGGRIGFADGGDPELSPEDQALAATMTHQPEQPNLAQPYLNAISSMVPPPVDLTPVHLPGSKPEDYLRELNDPAVRDKAIQQAGNFNWVGSIGDKGFIGGKPFYSAAQDAAANSKAKVMQPQQWLGYLKNQPGVKPAELEHVDLENWLKNQTGPVSRETLNDYIASKQPEIQEVRKGGIDEYSKALDAVGESNKQLQEKYGNLTDAFQRWTPQEQQAHEDLEYALHSAREKISGGNTVKHEQYQLPGAKEGSYGETLLTLPYNGPVPMRKQFTLISDVDGSAIAEGDETAAARWRRDFPGRHIEESMIPDTRHGMGNPNNYQSTHWDEPNVLLHIRHNDRQLPGVGNSLHMEELQSDLMQSHRNIQKEISDHVDRHFDDLADKMVQAGAIKKVCD